MAATADLLIRVITDTSKATGDLDAAGGKFSKFSGGIRKAALPAAAAIAAIGAAAIAAGNAAAEDAQAQVILATNLKNTTGATDKQVAATEAYISKMSMATGVADDQLRPAMSTLAGATGDVGKAQEELGVAMDVAASSGKDVEAVAKAMAKAHAGSTGSLKKLVPALDDATLKSGDMTAIMADLADKTGGAAAAAADTAAGKMAKMKNGMAEAQEEIGTALLPAMSKLSDFLAKVARFAQKHPALFRAVAGAIAALAAVIIVLNIAMGAYTAITTLAAAATWATLAPILLIIGAVALLAIGFILLWKKSETFRDIVTGVWEAVKTAALFYFGIVKAYVQTVIAVLKAVWKTLQPVVEAVWEKVKTFTGIAVDYIQDKWAKWFPIIKAAFQDLKEKGGALWDVIKPKVQDVIDKVKKLYNDYLQPIVDFVVAHKEDIANFFSQALGPLFTLIEAAKELNSLLDKIADKGGGGVKKPYNPPGSGGGGGTTRVGVSRFAAPGVVGTPRGTVRAAAPVVVTVNGALDPEAVARQIRRILAGHDRRVGVAT